ncbi:hypothetical protein A5764_22865 [Mycobacterium sp. 852002-51057_SCH5723018]|nr:hypothetical protein A5764_22865 [Mycobacterium sp. 852002-51057_SCH5723018]
MVLRKPLSVMATLLACMVPAVAYMRASAALTTRVHRGCMGTVLLPATREIAAHRVCKAQSAAAAGRVPPASSAVALRFRRPLAERISQAPLAWVRSYREAVSHQLLLWVGLRRVNWATHSLRGW